MAFYVEGLSGHHDPQPQVRRIGEYETVAEAIAVSQLLVDEFLRHELRQGMDAEALFTRYKAHGEYPFIFRDGDSTVNVPGFNHINYAMKRAAELCGGTL